MLPKGSKCTAIVFNNGTFFMMKLNIPAILVFKEYWSTFRMAKPPNGLYNLISGLVGRPIATPGPLKW